MKDGRGLTKGLAIVGTGLVWLLLAATLSAPLAGFIPDDVGGLSISWVPLWTCFRWSCLADPCCCGPP